MTNRQQIKCLFGFHDYKTVILDVVSKSAATIATIKLCQHCQYYVHQNNFPNTRAFWDDVVVCYRLTGRTRFTFKEVEKLSAPTVWAKIKKAIKNFRRVTWP